MYKDDYELYEKFGAMFECNCMRVVQPVVESKNDNKDDNNNEMTTMVKKNNRF